MYSGKNGAILYTFQGDTYGGRFGCSVAGVGDLNGDGYPDIIVGASEPVLSGAKGYVKIFSGKDGKVIRKISGSKVGDSFGLSVAAAGDVNGDNVPDVIVGAPQDNNGGNGYAKVYSGKDGSVLYTFTGKRQHDMFGTSVNGGTDLDKDGRPDLLVGVPESNVNYFANGSAFAFSGKTGAVLFTVYGDSSNDKLGTAVAGIGDVNGDGYGDFAAGAPFDNGGGSLHVFSGKDGKRLHRFDGDSTGDLFGSAVAGLGDVNKDGRVDFVVGAPGDDNTASAAGSARVFSGQKLSFWSDEHQLSLKVAGTQKLSLSAGAAHANRSYQIFGSATGSIPGISIASVLVPLNVDSYTHFAIAHANSAVMKDFRGKLDGNGNASASFNVPSGLPALLDMTLYHAFLVYDGAGIYMASNATTLRLEN